jgi:hypothetical protein
MRRPALLGSALCALVLALTPAAASAAPPGARAPVAALPAAVPARAAAVPTAAGRGSGGGWVPAPTPPFDLAAGSRCDFPVHGEPIVDQVRMRVLSSNPDGTPSRAAFTGALVIRVTNTATGASYDADASGSAIVVYHADTSTTWYIAGPILLGVADHGGNLPRGLYVVDGVYRLQISATGFRTVTMVRGTTDNVCARIG